MQYPEFFDKVEKITLQDPLSKILGTFEDGIIEFSYTDIVKSAGHSCPTVAGAYLCTLKGLQELYKNQIPVRGNIKVEFKETIEDGVAGVIGAVISNITGATTNTGFKGLNGNFDRRDLMFYGQEIESSVRFTRVDSGKSVDVFYNPDVVMPDPNLQPLMGKVIHKQATSEEIELFGILWQNRVEKILINNHKTLKIIEIYQE